MLQPIHISEAFAFSSEKMKKVNLFQSERFFLDVYGLEPGQEQSPHKHDGADKIYLVLEGAVCVRVGEDEVTLTRDMAVHAPAGAMHGLRNTSNDRASVLVFMGGALK